MARPRTQTGTKARAPRPARARRTAPAAPGRVLVTGASAGIGAEIARRFAQRGYDLVLVARTREKLETLAVELRRDHDRQVEVLPADLARPEAPARLFDGVRRRGLDIGVLVNNAGVLEMGGFDAIDDARHLELIDLNVRALTGLTHRFLGPMLAAGRGRILNVASIAAFQPLPSLATYAATKAFVLSLTESLAEELKGRGVTATALCPGITDTQMFGAIKSTRRITRKLPRAFVSDVGTVAEEGVRACLAGEVVCVPGLLNEVAALGSRATPKWLVRALFGAVGRTVLGSR